MRKVRWVEMVPEFPRYWISDDGRVIGRRGRELSLQEDNGRFRVPLLGTDGRLRSLSVNRLARWYFNAPDSRSVTLEEIQELFRKRQEAARQRAIARRHQLPGYFPQPPDGRRISPERLKAFRMKAGMNVEELAEIVGIHPATIYRIENEGRMPHGRTLHKLADALNVSVADLLTQNGDGKKVMARNASGRSG